MKDIKQTIRALHALWYAEPGFLESPKQTMLFHGHMEDLFNYAGITESLVKNNPNEVSPEEFARITGVKL